MALISKIQLPGVNTVEFYADLAKAFLFDKDAKGPEKKIAAYYNCIVDVD